MSDCCSTATIELPVEPRVAGKIRTVALVGPPNSGKSTLFNRLTGLRQKVANYPGVTVEQRVGASAASAAATSPSSICPGSTASTPIPKTRA